MQALIRSDERGHADRGWLESWHSFSFSDYYDPQRMGFGALRVINEDIIVPTAGFPPHSHQDMEIITYVLEGTIRHRDSTGGSGDLRHGELQVMHAGGGITHSEINPSAQERTHLLQIWIQPDRRGHAAGYEQAPLDAEALRRGFATAVGPKGSGAPFQINQDARLDIAWLADGQVAEKALDAQRLYYLHVARGQVVINGETFSAGDALALKDEAKLAVTGRGEAEVLLFDLA
ncbi:quercetin 2,3-dioxygenase [Solimonas fluminis]|uniref:Quercetin 2,3-dioxygenase n=1 Tax=Solimonas fluminis TaxID=2086571 RepID=A0A2S5TIY2_9GAMM|nr:pirin family protein [Solimonas fluminis]PPE74943.1 quercetin 2,3-dioxygenase [Solimonas fluminis]